MKVLITGINGFIGRWTAAHFARKQHNVLGIMRYPVSVDAWHVYAEELLGRNIPQENIDIFNIENIDEHTDWGNLCEGIDVVIHLAARVHITKEFEIDPLDKFRSINVRGTRKLAYAAAQAGVKRFIYLSSIKVLGENSDLKGFTETSPPDPSDDYAKSKYEGELALQQVCKDFSMEYVIIRPPLVYGPGVAANFYKLMQIINSGWPLPFAGVNNKRSFIAVENLIDFMHTVATHPQAANETFLISDGIDLSTKQLMHKLNRKVFLIWVPHWLVKLTTGWLNKQALERRLYGCLCLDIEKAKQLLDWQAPMDQDLALQQTMHWAIQDLQAKAQAE